MALPRRVEQPSRARIEIGGLQFHLFFSKALEIPPIHRNHYVIVQNAFGLKKIGNCYVSYEVSCAWLGLKAYAKVILTLPSPHAVLALCVRFQVNKSVSGSIARVN